MTTNLGIKMCKNVFCDKMESIEIGVYHQLTIICSQDYNEWNKKYER